MARPADGEGSGFTEAVYSSGRMALQLSYTSGRTYQYFDVPREVYQGLITAPSWGAYFNRNIRGVYRYARLDGGDGRMHDDAGASLSLPALPVGSSVLGAADVAVSEGAGNKPSKLIPAAREVIEDWRANDPDAVDRLHAAMERLEEVLVKIAHADELVQEAGEYQRDFADGKYTLIHLNGTGLRALRYGEEWRDLVGDGMVLAMLQEVEELDDRLGQALAGGSLFDPEDCKGCGCENERACVIRFRDQATRKACLDATTGQAVEGDGPLELSCWWVTETQCSACYLDGRDGVEVIVKNGVPVPTGAQASQAAAAIVKLGVRLVTLWKSDGVREGGEVAVEELDQVMDQLEAVLGDGSRAGVPVMFVTDAKQLPPGTVIDGVDMATGEMVKPGEGYLCGECGRMRPEVDGNSVCPECSRTRRPEIMAPSKDKRTNRAIVDQTNALARELASFDGYAYQEGYRFDQVERGRAVGYWERACAAQELLTGTDVQNALAGIES